MLIECVRRVKYLRCRRDPDNLSADIEKFMLNDLESAIQRMAQGIESSAPPTPYWMKKKDFKRVIHEPLPFQTATKLPCYG